MRQDCLRLSTTQRQPEGVDTVRAAILGSEKDNPLIGPAFDSFIDYSQHRDELLKGNGVYK